MKKGFAYKVLILALAVSGCVSHAGNETLYEYLESITRYIPNKFTMSVGEEIRYEDNISEAVRRDEVSSYIFETNINMSLIRHKDWLSYGVEGKLAYEHYTKHSGDFSNFDYYLVPVLNFDADFDGGFLGGTFQITFDSSSGMEVVEVGEDNEYARNYTNGVRLVWDMNRHERWGMMVTGDAYYDYYPENDFEDLSKRTYNAGILPYYVLSKKTKIGIAFDYEKTEYDESGLSDNSDKYSVGGFVDYRITSKMSLTAKVGLETSSYDGVSGHDSDNEDTTLYYDVVYRFTPVSNIALDLNASRSQENGTRGRGMNVEDKYGARVTWMPTRKLTVSNGITATHIDERSNRADKMEYLYEFDVRYKYRKNWTIYGGYSYEISHNIKDHDLDNDMNIAKIGANWSF